MARTKKTEAFDLTMTNEEATTLAGTLARQITDARSARDSVTGDGGLIDYADWFYEQGQSQQRSGQRADLTSYIITENVDALRARLMKTCFGVQPFCAVEGWGEASKDKAPAIEAFHEWQVKEEGLIPEMTKYVHAALLEDCAILEVRPRVDVGLVREEVDAALELTAEGAAIFEPDGRPRIVLEDDGEPRRAAEGDASARLQITRTQTRYLGPQFDVISMKDFVYLPGHAKNARQLWGHAKRFWLRVSEIQERVDRKVFDADQWASTGRQSDRNDGTAPPTVDSIAAQYDDSDSEKELWEISLKRDLDGDGLEEWYFATISVQHQTILRLKRDHFIDRVGMSRCVPLVLFPRRNSVYGYSYAWNKLVTLAEEHTALRNMTADRSALATNPPIMQTQGGLWDPDDQPIGTGEVITVRDFNELKQMTFADVPQSAVWLTNQVMQAKERVGGLADTAIGVQSAERRTLGENQMVAAGSAVRVEEAIGHLRLAISAIMRLRHEIWIETLDQRGGLDVPDVVAKVGGAALAENRGVFTAEMLRGQFQFQPYGSVETADPHAQMQYFSEGLKGLASLAQMMPSLQAVLQSPDVAQEVLEQWGRVYKVRNLAPFMEALRKQQPSALGLPGQMPPAGGMGMGTGGPRPTPPMARRPPQAPPPPPPPPPGGDLKALLAMLQQGGAPPPPGGARVQ